MKYRWKVAIWILGLALGGLILVVLMYRQTLAGIIAEKYMRWEEDSFKGKPLSELESECAKHGQVLVPVDSGSLYAVTNWRLRPNQRGLQFVKGKEYPWFRLGLAINIGYVVVEKSDETETVVEIIHGRSVDSL